MLWYNVGTHTDLKHGLEGLEVPEELLHGHLAGVEHVVAAQLAVLLLHVVVHELQLLVLLLRCAHETVRGLGSRVTPVSPHPTYALS